MRIAKKVIMAVLAIAITLTSLTSFTDARFKTIADEIKMLDEKLHVAMKLKAMTTALLRTSKKQEEIKEFGYYVLQLGYEDHVLNILFHHHLFCIPGTAIFPGNNEFVPPSQV